MSTPDRAEKLEAALRALLATLPTCSFQTHTTDDGEEHYCPEVATATLRGPHDNEWEMCLAQAKAALQ